MPVFLWWKLAFSPNIFVPLLNLKKRKKELNIKGQIGRLCCLYWFGPFSLSLSLSHTHTHTHTHAYIHTHTLFNVKSPTMDRVHPAGNTQTCSATYRCIYLYTYCSYRRIAHREYRGYTIVICCLQLLKKRTATSWFDSKLERFVPQAQGMGIHPHFQSWTALTHERLPTDRETIDLLFA